MIRSRTATYVALAAAGVVLGWTLYALPHRQNSATVRAGVVPPPSAAAPAAPGRKIKAHLFYVSDDGMHLVRVERDVPYGEGTLEQAREILAAQVTPVGEPLVSAIPAGATVRALFLTEGGEAYVDFSREITAGHTGGTSDELLTIYTIVNALTENLPAVTAVQVLVDGKEVDTLAGHIDLRNPIARNPAWVQ